MNIYDISQELLSSVVYPGDPVPRAELVSSIAVGEQYNLTTLSLCAHNGTHIDAPRHFIDGATDVAGIPLEKLVGAALVTSRDGELTAEDAVNILALARTAHTGSPVAALDPDGAGKRILIKGNATVTADAAKAFASSGISLLGVESQSVGPSDAPMEVHEILLSRSVVLLEGIRLTKVPDGTYLLAAQPISILGADGAPCRAILIEP